MILLVPGPGPRVASEYWGKVYTVLDSVRRRRRTERWFGSWSQWAIAGRSQKKRVEMASQASAPTAPCSQLALHAALASGSVINPGRNFQLRLSYL